jgi:chloramphenicol 3-O phosphotransferase
MTRIILLNGVSSAGKTSIAEELVDLLDPPHFRMAVDAFGRMRSAATTNRLRPAEVDEVLRKTRAGFHRAVAGMAAAGNDVVFAAATSASHPPPRRPAASRRGRRAAAPP